MLNSTDDDDDDNNIDKNSSNNYNESASFGNCLCLLSG
jgi:hypothetical protein